MASIDEYEGYDDESENYYIEEESGGDGDWDESGGGDGEGSSGDGEGDGGGGGSLKYAIVGGFIRISAVAAVLAMIGRKYCKREDRKKKKDNEYYYDYYGVVKRQMEGVSSWC